MKHCKIFVPLALFLLAGLLSGCNKENLPEDNSDDTGKNGKPDTLAYNLDIFPEDADPEEIGVKLTEHFIQTPHSYWGNINSSNTPDHITYPDVCAWLGALWFTQTVGNDDLYNQLVDRFDLLFTTEKHLQPSLTPSAANKVDYYVFGAIPLEIYLRKKESRYLDLGMKYADGQWTLPSNATQAQKDWHESGYSWQTRLWVDDMFMITALQNQAFLATGEEQYIDRTAREMVLYLDRLQRSSGLFYHAPSAPYFWGRGNGWFAVGMVEVLRRLPQDERYSDCRERILQAYRKMMDTLRRYQMKDGMWGQLVDDLSSWKETSASAMFTYAMITGVKNGWLDRETYGAVARKGWLALLTYLDDDHNLRNVCEGTGERNDYQYYINRKRLTGDLHGQASLLWCASALCR
ncbi:MAG: glycoside hydrolase family 88 protein [Dysgonamonadaceae bacterium]|nr:glycoside hydrolase family 88 protein [Dysgonamonadaceae bacterium]